MRYTEQCPFAVVMYAMVLLWYVVFLRVNNIVFVDESGLNRYYRREYARAKRGVKVYGKKAGIRHKRTNIIGALWNDKHIAMQCYEHSTTALFFEDWFEFDLIPLLPENALIIMDNASFHRKSKLYNIAGRYGIYVLFLPPYSPEFNRIEKSWANFKQWLKNNLHCFPCFDFAVEAYFT